MEFVERKIKGVIEVSLKPITDERGFFMRVYDVESFNKYAINNNWVQENHSFTQKKGTIRGLHFQFPPYSETKLVRCIKGAIFDVFVDLRIGSKTFGQWDSIELSEKNKKMILLPKGIAHGFCTITNNCEVLYKVDNFYSKENESGLLWNDKDLSIKWPVRTPILSEKDKLNITFREFANSHQSLLI